MGNMMDAFLGSGRYRRNYRDGQRFDDSNLTRHRKRTVYDYRLSDGTLLYQQCRYDHDAGYGQDQWKKEFLVRRPAPGANLDADKGNSSFVFGAGHRRVIYNAAAVMRA